MMPPSDFPIVDGHLHPFLRSPNDNPFARYFTEAADAGIVRDHTPHSLFFRRAMRLLSELLGCPADAESVLRAREALGSTEYLRLLVREANLTELLIDDGYPLGAVTVEEIGEAGHCAARRICRIETLAESLFVNASSAADLVERTIDALNSQRGIVGLKTIIAYRCGLQISPVHWTEVERAFADERALAGWDQPRLTAKPLLTALLLAALEWAADRSIPVQFHTGYGDRDIDLLSANPIQLKGLLEDQRFAGTPIVLLHAAYPYCREASYLASVYPNVWIDWSAVNPMLSPVQLQRVVEELLDLAPYTKLLYGSDAWGIPDWIYLASRAGRQALAAALAEEPDCEEITRSILSENALALYHLQ
jgi:uncharacterized protein